jgi:hypothetical protein
MRPGRFVFLKFLYAVAQFMIMQFGRTNNCVFTLNVVQEGVGLSQVAVDQVNLAGVFVARFGFLKKTEILFNCGTTDSSASP